MKNTDMKNYLQSCRTKFWQDVFEAELKYILRYLQGVKTVLSVGCGPAIIERGLAENGLDVTGLDISEEAIQKAPDKVRTIAGSAENMTFESESFNAVIFVASLQFIEDYAKAIANSKQVLKPNGKLLVMLLNPESEFFKQKTSKPDSYVNKIKHTNLQNIEETIAEYFSVKTEYFLGIKGTKIFQSQDSKVASLYVIKGTKKQ